jgi:hypothetical protein
MGLEAVAINGDEPTFRNVAPLPGKSDSLAIETALLSWLMTKGCPWRVAMVMSPLLAIKFIFESSPGRSHTEAAR